MSTALQTCAARIEAALDYLGHEPDPIKAITLSEVQLRQALISVRAAQGLVHDRRADDKAPILTFLAGSRVQPSAWPPAERVKDAAARAFCRVFGEFPL